MMMDHLIWEDPILWRIILDDLTILMKNEEDEKPQVPEKGPKWDADDKLVIQNIAKPKKILIRGIA